jgi:translation elongation factor EF-4
MNCIQNDAAQGVEKILVGNKIDLPGRQIRAAQGEHVASQYGVKYVEASAKESVGVNEAFEALVKDIILSNPSCQIGAGGGAPVAPVLADGKGKKGKGKDGKGCSIL